MDDVELIKVTTESIVMKSEFQKVQDKLEDMVHIETFDQFVKEQSKIDYVSTAEFVVISEGMKKT